MANKKSKRSTGKGPAKKPANRSSARPAPAPGAAAGTQPTSQPQPTRTNREKRHQERDRARAAAAARKAAEARKSRLVNMVIIGAVVVLVMGLGLYIWKDLNKPVVEPRGMTADYGMVLGKADAPEKIVIIEDFLCGPCGTLEQQIGSSAKQATDTGNVSIEYRPINQLNTDYSKNAAQAFWAVLDDAGAEKATVFHDLLFANQPGEGEQGPSESWLADKAAEAGADRATVLSALEDDTYEGLVEEATRVAQQKGPKNKQGVFSTPGVLINGEPVTSASASDVISRVGQVLLAAITAAGGTEGATDGATATPSTQPTGGATSTTMPATPKATGAPAAQ